MKGIFVCRSSVVGLRGPLKRVRFWFDPRGRHHGNDRREETFNELAGKYLARKASRPGAQVGRHAESVAERSIRLPSCRRSITGLHHSLKVTDGRSIRLACTIPTR